MELLAGTGARPVPGWPRYLALSKVLTDRFSAAPEAADLTSGFEIHILINTSAFSDWQRLSGKENKKSLYTNRRSGVQGVAQHSSGGVAEVLPPLAAGLWLMENQLLADRAPEGGHGLPSCGGGPAPLAVFCWDGGAGQTSVAALLVAMAALTVNMSASSVSMAISSVNRTALPVNMAVSPSTMAAPADLWLLI